MNPEERLEERVVEKNLIERTCSKKKELKEKHLGVTIAEGYIPTKDGLKYVAVFRNGSIQVVSNVLPKGDYDNEFKPEIIMNMFTRRVRAYY